jgi:hypothetical protein
VKTISDCMGMRCAKCGGKIGRKAWVRDREAQKEVRSGLVFCSRSCVETHDFSNFTLGILNNMLEAMPKAPAKMARVETVPEMVELMERVPVPVGVICGVEMACRLKMARGEADAYLSGPFAFGRKEPWQDLRMVPADGFEVYWDFELWAKRTAEQVKYDRTALEVRR